MLIVLTNITVISPPNLSVDFTLVTIHQKASLTHVIVACLIMKPDWNKTKGKDNMPGTAEGDRGAQVGKVEANRLQNSWEISMQKTKIKQTKKSCSTKMNSFSISKHTQKPATRFTVGLFSKD